MKILVMAVAAASLISGRVAASPIVFTTSGTILPFEDVGYTTVLDVDLAQFPTPASSAFEVRVTLDYDVLLTGVAYHDLNPPGTVVQRAFATKLDYVVSGAFPPDLTGFNYTFLTPSARASEHFASSQSEQIAFSAVTDKNFGFGDTHLLFVTALLPNDLSDNEFVLNWSATYTTTVAFVPEATSLTTAAVAFVVVIAARTRRVGRAQPSA